MNFLVPKIQIIRMLPNQTAVYPLPFIRGEGRVRGLSLVSGFMRRG